MFLVWIFVFMILIPGIALVFLKRKQEKEKQAKAAAAAEKQRKLEAEKAARKAERDAREARIAEWNEKHGRIVTALAGVTFDNEDGTSRQQILRGLQANDGVCDLELEPYTWKGSPAIRVLVDGECAGNIRKSDVQKILEVYDRIENVGLEVETFRNDDDDLIYRADVTVIYAK